MRLRRIGPLRFSVAQARCPNSLRSDTGQLFGLSDLRCSARFRRANSQVQKPLQVQEQKRERL